MKISIGSKQYTFTGVATPANIAGQIAAQESGINPDKISQKLSQVVFGAAYRKHDEIGDSHFKDGVLSLDAHPFERLLGLVNTGSTNPSVVLVPPPPVVVRDKSTKSLVAPPSVPSDILAAIPLIESQTPEVLKPGSINKAALEAHPVFQHSIAPLLSKLRFTTFELTTTDRDTKLETGAYFNPKSNCVVLDQNQPMPVILDNLIFELCNAKFKNEFESISSAFDQGSISVSDYGNAYAATEFKTQMAYTSILQELKQQGFELPKGAQKALAWIEKTDPSFASTKDTAKLLTSFMTLPHNVHAEARDVASLPSPEMYAFQALEKIGGQKLFDLIETKVGKGVLPASFSGWARHNFPMKSVSYKRAKAYEEVILKASQTLHGQSAALTELSKLQLSSSLSEYAALRAGPSVMPAYHR
jgi:hypothetical protein